MKELDLRGNKWLYKFLSINHNGKEISDVVDICTLTRMLIVSLICWMLYGLGIIASLAVVIGMLSPLVLISLWFPDGWQASVGVLEIGVKSLFSMLVIGVFSVITGVVMFLLRDLDFAPEYMKRPLRKLFKRVPVENKKSPSKVVLTLKECYKSWKEKTCIKVKL